MTESATIDFQRLSDLLGTHGALATASELHGHLTGQLVTGRRFSRGEWLRMATDQAEMQQTPSDPAGDDLYQLYQQTLTALSSGDLAFAPLLAPEEQSLAERLESLARWCQGFLSGFGLAGGGVPDDETAETLRDIAAVAQVRNDEEETEQNEGDLFAVSEYLRMAVLNLFLQNQPKQPSPNTAPAASPSAASPASLFKRGKLH